MNIRKIRDSFRLPGVVPFDLGVILSQYTTPISAVDGLAIAASLPRRN
jgi:hypothetical protein